MVSGWVLNSAYQQNSSIVKDLKNINNLTPTAITYTSTSATFNGSSSKMLGSGAILSNNHSFLCVFKASDQAKYSSIVSQRQAAATGRWLIGANGSSTNKAVIFGTDAADHVSTSTVFDGLWHSLLFVFNGTNWRIFFDGNMTSDTTVTTSTAILNAKFCLGANTEGADGFLNGQIAFAAVFSGDVSRYAYKLHRNIPVALKLRQRRIGVIGSSSTVDYGSTGGSTSTYYGSNGTYGILRTAERAAFRELIDIGVYGSDSGQGSPDTYSDTRVSIDRNITKLLYENQIDMVICHYPGGNEILSGYTNSQIISKIQAIKAICDAMAIPILIGTASPRNDLTAPNQTQYIALKNLQFSSFAGSVLFDIWNPTVTGSNTLLGSYDSGDGLHFNDAGHALRATIIASTSNDWVNGTPNFYNGLNDFNAALYAAHLKGTNDGNTTYVLKSAKNLDDACNWLRTNNLFQGLTSFIPMTSDLQYNSGSVFNSVTNRKPFFSNGSVIPTVSESGTNFSSTSIIIPNRFASTVNGALIGSFTGSAAWTVMIFASGSTQSSAYASLFSQHATGSNQRFIIGASGSGGTNVGFFYNDAGSSRDVFPTNGWFDGNVRSLMVSHNGSSRISLRINGSAAEIGSSVTANNVLLATACMGTNVLGTGTAYLDGKIKLFMTWNSDVSASYGSIHSNMNSYLKLGAS